MKNSTKKTSYELARPSTQRQPFSLLINMYYEFQCFFSSCTGISCRSAFYISSISWRTSNKWALKKIIVICKRFLWSTAETACNWTTNMSWNVNKDICLLFRLKRDFEWCAENLPMNVAQAKCREEWMDMRECKDLEKHVRLYCIMHFHITSNIAHFYLNLPYFGA